MLTHKPEESTCSVCFASRNKNAESLERGIKTQRGNKTKQNKHQVSPKSQLFSVKQNRPHGCGPWRREPAVPALCGGSGCGHRARRIRAWRPLGRRSATRPRPHAAATVGPCPGWPGMGLRVSAAAGEAREKRWTAPVTASGCGTAPEPYRRPERLRGRGHVATRLCPPGRAERRNPAALNSPAPPSSRLPRTPAAGPGKGVPPSLPLPSPGRSAAA